MTPVRRFIWTTTYCLVYRNWKCPTTPDPATPSRYVVDRSSVHSHCTHIPEEWHHGSRLLPSKVCFLAHHNLGGYLLLPEWASLSDLSTYARRPQTSRVNSFKSYYHRLPTNIAEIPKIQPRYWEHSFCPHFRTTWPFVSKGIPGFLTQVSPPHLEKVYSESFRASPPTKYGGHRA